MKVVISPSLIEDASEDTNRCICKKCVEAHNEEQGG
jgi:hypothetical protein